MSKVWLITGCSTGFGRLLAQELLKTPAKVVATARDISSLAPLKGINDKNLLTLSLDVTKSGQIVQAVEHALEHFGRIDVLVNNAGYGLLGAVEETDMEAYRRLFETNVFGLIELTKIVLPLMRQQKSGHIFNLSSISGLVSVPGISGYNATKFAVEGFSEALAGEVAPFGIKVTIVEPSQFRTDFFGRSMDVVPPMAEYKDTIGKFRQMIKQADGNQPGDPLKVVRILIDVVTMPEPPLRLPLGNMAIDRIKTKIKTWEKDIKAIEPLARSADYAQEAAE